MNKLWMALLASGSLILSACGIGKTPMQPLTVQAYNHTPRAIDFNILGEGRTNFALYKGGGYFSTAAYQYRSVGGGWSVPRKWDKNYNLTIQWQLRGGDEENPHFSTIYLPPYSEDDLVNLDVHFFKDGTVKALVSRKDPDYEDYPYDWPRNSDPEWIKKMGKK